MSKRKSNRTKKKHQRKGNGQFRKLKRRKR